MDAILKKQIRSLSLRVHPKQRQALIVSGVINYIERIETENKLLNDLVSDLYCQIGKEGSGRAYIDQQRQKIDAEINHSTKIFPCDV